MELCSELCLSGWPASWTNTTHCIGPYDTHMYQKCGMLSFTSV